MAVLYVDPISNVASCSNGNSGASASVPICGLSEVVGRWTTNSPSLNQVTTIFLQSSAPATDPLNMSPQTFGSGALVVNGLLTSVATPTIGTFTARVRASGVTNKITASGQSGAYWSSFVGDLVNDTTASAWFWVEKDLGSAQAQITEPFNTVTTSPTWLPTTYETIANGDSLVVYSVPTLACHNFTPGPAAKSALAHVHCINDGVYSTINGASVSESRLSATSLVGGAGSLVNLLGNSYVDGTGSFLAAGIVGGAVTASTPRLGVGQGDGHALAFVDGDVLIDTGGPFHTAQNLIFGRAYLGTGVYPDVDEEGQTSGVRLSIGYYDRPGVQFADSELWGPGRVDLFNGATFVCQDSVNGCAGQLLLTGTLTIHGGSTGFPWIAGSNAWGASTTITPAAIDSDTAICDPATGDCFRSRL